PQGWISSENRHHFKTEYPKELRIAKHVGKLDAERTKETTESHFVPQDASLERAQCGAADVPLRSSDSSLDRRPGVVAKVVVVPIVHGVQEQAQLDVLDPRFRCHRGLSHILINESKRSTSMGFVT